MGPGITMVIGVDDSDIVVEAKPHTILAAVMVKDVVALDRALQQLKQQFGVAPGEEIKWNGMRLEKRAREEISEELLQVLHETLPLVTISESCNRQLAAELLAAQISDCLAAHSYLGQSQIEVVFDEGILKSESGFKAALGPSAPLAKAMVRQVRSHDSSAVQLADVLAGFNRLCTEMVLGRPLKQIQVWDDGLNDLVQMDLLSYINLALRWAMWGEVPSPPDPDNITFDGRWPFKHVGGYGLRMHSSVDSGIVKEIYDARVVYMGCLH